MVSEDNPRHSSNRLVDRVIDEMFEGNVGSVESLCGRKKAIADPDRYNALYYVYKRDADTFESDLRQSELPTNDVEPLLSTNLLAHSGPIPGTDDYRVRITILGQQEIEADLARLRGDDSDE